ncbi:sugar phosphate isomerase/epimerase [Synechococcus sp. PCC 6312]|uniref:sugar phosphate isomerase/epimerase family protein n=1 Tax=Synechococcus sp. (strain ATCC 27167 / PCC 6312) TaxID=195253 RepID=UPI00029F23A3|nr:sugar phosphate isomerase/epimerase family protein [Synechococcus sp. PCC 6312]AFY61242.1 sugar phosphate isomerase/epimerase [Synechococcus sp. PCC 6312]
MVAAIRFGVHSFIWKQEFFGNESYIFEQAQAWGFDGVEISTHYFADISPDTIKAYRDRYGIEITLCTSMPTGLSLTSDDPECWQKSVQYVKDAITFAQACDITQLSGPLIHPVSYLTGKPLQPEETPRLHQALTQIADALSQTNIKLAIEPLNRFQGYALNTVAQGLELLNHIGSPQLGLLLDLFHMNIEEKDIVKAFLAAGDKCFHVHACACDRGIPGSDTMPWPGLFQALDTLNFNGWIVIESFNREDQALATAARVWRPLADSSEQIARDGLQFLQHTYQATR